MTSILRAVIQGLEATSENNGVGGMASTFQLLEIAHTHYWEKDAAVRNDISPMSERNSPLNGSRESLASIDPTAPISPLSNLVSLQKPVTLASPTAQFVAHLGNVHEFSPRCPDAVSRRSIVIRRVRRSFQGVSGASRNLPSLVAMHQPHRRRWLSRPIWSRTPTRNSCFRRMLLFILH